MILANLDCEAEWTGTPLPAAVLTRLAALGTLLRAFDPDVELLGPVPAARQPTGIAYRSFTLRDLSVSHTGGEVGTSGPIVAWGATARREGSGDVGIARACNDRRLAVGLSEPGDARVVTTIEELEQVIAPWGEWVAKATICAAGRDRVRRKGAIDAATRTRLARLLAPGGALVVEPWRARTLDLGQPGVVDARGEIALAPPHRLICDPGGGFRGVAIGPDPQVAPYADALADAGRRAGAAIAARGYRGPFVVDAFVHGDGELRAICEINARLTFGWVARAWAAHLGDGTLTLGRGAPPADATPLLLPGDADDTSAWFTSSRR